MNSIQNKKMVILFGPTGVGKSDLAIRLAHAISGEIVNMDMGQLYTPLSIGTAKPLWQESSIPHHLFDYFNKPQHCTAMQYRALLLKTLKDIWGHKKTPIVVGGCGFYLMSLLFPINQVDAPYYDTDVLYPSGVDIWHELFLIDPERALKIDKNDTYRIKRALSIWHTTGTKPSLSQPHYNPPASYVLIYLDRHKTDLYTRINNRVISMIQEGWIDEVKNILSTEWEDFLLQKKLIGYDDLILFLKNDPFAHTQEKTIALIQQKTRHYAKRQGTFWRTLTKKLALIDTNNKEIDMSHVGLVDAFNMTDMDSEMGMQKIKKMLSTIE